MSIFLQIDDDFLNTSVRATNEPKSKEESSDVVISNDFSINNDVDEVSHIGGVNLYLRSYATLGKALLG